MVLALSILLAIFVLEDPWTWVAVALGATFELGETGFLIWWSKRRRVAVGTETLVGRRAIVSVDCMPDGVVTRFDPRAVITDFVVWPSGPVKTAVS